MKVVLDTNILISSLFWSGVPRLMVNLAISQEINSFTSIYILEELQSVLFESFNLPKDKIKDIIKDVLSYSEVIKTKDHHIKIRDQKDAKVIDCAISVKASYIITGDKDLLVLKQVKKIKILTPSDFLKTIKSA